MECEFTVNQRVACVDDQWVWGNDGDSHGLIVPKLNHTYTVRWLGIVRFIPEGPLPAVLLEEIVNPQIVFNGVVMEFPFYHGRFRPLQERQTSIEVFQTIRRRVSGLEPVS